MAESFSSEYARQMLKNKFIVIIGDSVHRGIYKDLVHFLQRDSYITNADLRAKGEWSFCGDKLYEGGRLDVMSNTTQYREIRQYQTDFNLIRFYFVTRVYSAYFETIVADLLHDSSPKPDVIMMNSCVWDMTRFGPRWLDMYKENLDEMLNVIKAVAKDSLFIWNTCMPIGRKARGGFMPENQEWKKDTVRIDVMEANFFASQAVKFHGFNVVDLNYHFREYSHLRAADDVHWVPVAHRKITNLILSHICEAWNLPKPRSIKPLKKKVTPLMSLAPNQHTRGLTAPARCAPPGNHLSEIQNRDPVIRDSVIRDPVIRDPAIRDSAFRDPVFRVPAISVPRNVNVPHQSYNTIFANPFMYHDDRCDFQYGCYNYIPFDMWNTYY